MHDLRLLEHGITDAQLRKLAGNSFCGFAFMPLLISVLVHWPGRRHDVAAPGPASSDQQAEGADQAHDHDLAVDALLADIFG